MIEAVSIPEGLTHEQARLCEEAYQKLKISTKQDKEPYVFISYKSHDFEKVFIETVYPTQEKFGLRIYCDKAFSSRNDHWLAQMKENLTATYCPVMLCFLSKSYMCSYATLLELLHSQVGGSYNKSIPMIPILLEDVPLQNDDSFDAYDLELAKLEEDTGLPLFGPERQTFQVLLDKMLKKLVASDGYQNRCEDTLDFCQDYLLEQEKGVNTILDTRFCYRISREIINYLSSNTIYMMYEQFTVGSRRLLHKTLREKIKNTATQDVFVSKSLTGTETHPTPKVEGITKRRGETLRPETGHIVDSSSEKISQKCQKPEEGGKGTKNSSYSKDASLLEKRAVRLHPDQCTWEGAVCTGIKEEYLDNLPEVIAFPLSTKSLKRLLPPQTAVSVKGVYLHSGIEALGEECFMGFPHLETIHLPETLCHMGDKVFWHCKALSQITLPSTLSTLGFAAFCACSSLKTIEIPQGVRTIAEETFSGCSALESVKIADSVTKISSAAFASCGKLQSIYLPDSVKTMETGAFFDCSSLKNIHLSESISKIGAFAFQACIALEKITLPESVKQVEMTAFQQCRNLKTVTIKNKSLKIPPSTWNGTGYGDKNPQKNKKPVSGKKYP